jgi:TrmH family RNA methyltransferase
MKQEAKARANRAQADRLRPIAGRHNRRAERIAARLPPRRADTASGECAIEGVKLIEEALRSGRHLDSVFFSESARPLAEKLLPQINAPHRGARPAECTLQLDRAERGATRRGGPAQAASFLAAPTARSVQTTALSGRGRGLQDPGNLGTILRSAEAFGAAGIFLTEGTVSLYNWKVLRGFSRFDLPLAFPAAFLRGTASASARARRPPVRDVFAPGNSAARISWTLPLAIFIGNEGAGLSRELMREMDETVVIPQSAQVESLNAGVAASIVLYEAAQEKFVMGDL